MIATVAVSAVLAIIVIAALAALLIIRVCPFYSIVLFDGIFEGRECLNFIDEDGEMIYSFSTMFSYHLRKDEHLFRTSVICRLPLSAENLSGGYIPQPEHSIRITGQYNLFGYLLSYKFERLPDLEVVEPIPDPFPDPDF